MIQRELSQLTLHRIVIRIAKASSTCTFKAYRMSKVEWKKLSYNSPL